jgi:hypothetical protein
LRQFELPGVAVVPNSVHLRDVVHQVKLAGLVRRLARWPIPGGIYLYDVAVQ